MSRKLKFSVALLWVSLAAISCSEDDPKDSNDLGASDQDVSDLGRDMSEPDQPHELDQGLPKELPQLGVYTVNLDGSDLRLVADTGDRLMTHVRAQKDSDWVTATRYNVDLDGNGLAMEGEGGGAPNYTGTEIVLFQRGNPDQVHTLAAQGLECDLATTICANSSWTDDGNLIALNISADSDGRDWLKRVTLGEIPTAASVATIPIPVGLFFPVDPHQIGDAATGSIVFAGVFNQGTQANQEWTRPIWKMPAEGAATVDQAEFVGCPICPSQSNTCCNYPTPEIQTGTNDPRFSHDGNTVVWMQSNAEESATLFGQTIFPYRQYIRPTDASVPQVALDTTGALPPTSHAYAEFSPDDSQLVYWEIQILGDTAANFKVKERVFTTNLDGTNRTEVPLPEELCGVHPSYLDDDTIIFSGWLCGGSNCSCAQAALSAD